MPKAPPWLSKAAKAVFKRIARELADAGVAATVDVELVASLATASADLAAVSKAIQAGGVVVTVPVLDRHGQPVPGRFVSRPNPLLRAQDSLLARVKQLADALNLSPAARSRQGSAAQPEAPTPATNKVLALRERIQAARAAAAGGSAG